MRTNNQDKMFIKQNYILYGQELGVHIEIAEFLYENLKRTVPKFDRRYYEINARLWKRCKINTVEQAAKQFQMDEKRRIKGIEEFKRKKNRNE